jgi:hypothetical protein
VLNFFRIEIEIEGLRIGSHATIVAIPNAEVDNAHTARLLDLWTDGLMLAVAPVTAARTVWFLVGIVW